MKIKKSIICVLFVVAVQSLVIINISNKNNKNLNEIRQLKKSAEELVLNNSELESAYMSLSKELNIALYDLEQDGFKKKVMFDTNNTTKESNATREQLLYALRDTKLVDYVDTFLEVEEKYKINCFLMIGIVANESGWLNSNRTINQNNVTGYAVYSNSSKGRTFSSIEESILVTAKTLAENYINPKGKYHEGVSTYDININYSADKDWCSIVNSVATNLVNDINSFTDFLYK